MSTPTVSNSVLVQMSECDKKVCDELQKGFSERIPLSTSLEKNCKEFLVDVKCYALMLQNQLTTAPTQEKLKQSEQIILNQYWDFIDTCKRIESAAFDAKCLTSFVSPLRYEAQINSPTVNIELAEQLKVLANRCTDYTKSLLSAWDNSKIQTDKIFGLLQGDIAKNISRFSQIVDKSGGPISLLAWKTTGAYFSYATVKQPEHRMKDSFPNGTFPRLCADIDVNRLALAGISVPQAQLSSNILQVGVKNPSTSIAPSLETSRTEPGTETLNTTENASSVPPAASISPQENSNTQNKNA